MILDGKNLTSSMTIPEENQVRFLSGQRSMPLRKAEREISDPFCLY